MNIDRRQYAKCSPIFYLYGHVKNMDVVEVEAKVVESVHWMMNHHFAYAQSSYTWSSSSALWTTTAASTDPSPFRVTNIAPCTSYLSPQAAFTLIHLVYAPDHGYPPHRP